MRLTERPSEVAALDRRYQVAVVAARTRGVEPELKLFEAEVQGSFAIMNRSLGAIDGWLNKSPLQFSFYRQVEQNGRTPRARAQATNIDLDEGTCSLDLREAASEYFRLTLAQARGIIEEVATVTSNWRDTAKAVGTRPADINRMARAIEHDDLKRAPAL